MKNDPGVAGDPEATVIYLFMCAVSDESVPQALQGWERQKSYCSKYLKWVINHKLYHRHKEAMKMENLKKTSRFVEEV